VNNKRITIRFEKKLHAMIEEFIETEGFDSYVNAVKFLLRFAYISRRTYNSSLFDDLELTYEDRIEKKMAFSEQLTQDVNSVKLRGFQPKHSFNDKVNILLWVGLKEYHDAMQKRKGKV
jgi:Arc/MetJ-type ribon-helix-helix transcriptional regulator